MPSTAKNPPLFSSNSVTQALPPSDSDGGQGVRAVVLGVNLKSFQADPVVRSPHRASSRKVGAETEAEPGLVILILVAGPIAVGL